jgi:hypothetical protein
MITPCAAGEIHQKEANIQGHFLDYLPLWLIYLLTVGLGLLAVEAGFRLGKYWKRRHPDEQETHIGAMIGATLGLWAFLLAFLVSMSTSRFDERRSLVVQEANSIGTTYLRAGYLPEPYSSESRELLREYAKLRLEMYDLDRYPEDIARSAIIHTELWSRAQELAIAQPSPVIALYITTLNETIDLHTTRLTALTTGRVPFTIYLSMYLVAALALLMLGFQSGISGQRDWIVTLTLILIFSAIMLLIVDLDRPWGGWLRVSQQPMIDLIGGFSSFK